MKYLLAQLSFVAGSVDTISYLTLDRLFTAHVTGNIVMAAADLVSDKPARLTQLALIPVFIIAVAASWLLIRPTQLDALASQRRLLWTQFILITGAFLIALTTHPSRHPESLWAAIVAVIAATAMGSQFALVRITMPGAPSTPVMTSNLTDAILSVLRGEPQRLSVLVLGAFFSGCFVAALAVKLLGDGAWILSAGVALAALQPKRPRSGAKSVRDDSPASSVG